MSFVLPSKLIVIMICPILICLPVPLRFMSWIEATPGSRSFLPRGLISINSASDPNSSVWTVSRTVWTRKRRIWWGQFCMLTVNKKPLKWFCGGVVQSRVLDSWVFQRCLPDSTSYRLSLSTESISHSLFFFPLLSLPPPLCVFPFVQLNIQPDHSSTQ